MFSAFTSPEGKTARNKSIHKCKVSGKRIENEWRWVEIRDQGRPFCKGDI